MLDQFKQHDWSLTTPEECDFVFRVWGNSKLIPYCSTSDEIDWAAQHSRQSFLFIKAYQPHVREVLDNLNIDRLLSTRPDSAGNFGGAVQPIPYIEREYILTCLDKNIDCNIIDITINK